ncbi:Hypothetical protein SRAE_0000080050, partial [Strongyloides ratti]
NKKYVGNIQVECVDDINFASVELLRNERTNSLGALTYNKATTNLIYDSNNYGNNTITFCNNDRNKFMNMKLLRKIVTPDNENGRPLLISLC